MKTHILVIDDADGLEMILPITGMNLGFAQTADGRCELIDRERSLGMLRDWVNIRENMLSFDFIIDCRKVEEAFTKAEYPWRQHPVEICAEGLSDTITQLRKTIEGLDQRILSMKARDGELEVIEQILKAEPMLWAIPSQSLRVTVSTLISKWHCARVEGSKLREQLRAVTSKAVSLPQPKPLHCPKCQGENLYAADSDSDCVEHVKCEDCGYQAEAGAFLR